MTKKKTIIYAILLIVCSIVLAGRLVLAASLGGTLDINSQEVVNVSTPTLDNNVANKEYVDDAIMWYPGVSQTYVRDNSWNVGIGTTNPTSKLQIGQDAVIQQWTGTAYPQVLITGADNEVETMILKIQDENLQEYFRVSTNGTGSSDRGKIYIGGSLGIGDTDPDLSLKLDVEGQVGATAYCEADGTNCQTVDQLLVGGSGGDITAVIAGTGLSGGGDTGDVTLNTDATYLQRRVSSSCIAGSSIRVINADGTVACETDDTGSGTSVWDTNGTSAYYNDGNVGIGTDSPERKLHITGGNILLDNTRTLQAKRSDNVTVDTWMWPRYSDNIMYTNFGPSGWNIRTNTSQEVMFMTNNGNVGIGVTTPSSKLQIRGNDPGTGITNGSFLMIDNESRGVDTRSGIKLQTYGSDSGDGKTGYVLLQAIAPNPAVYSSDFNIVTRNGGVATEVLRIKSNGNVGISTLTPQGRLTIDTPYSDTVGARKGLEFVTNDVNEWWSFGVDMTGDLVIDELTGTDTNVMTITTAGSVGIGVSAPSAKLDVNGTAEINGDLDMTQHEIKNMVIENRTTNPSSPQVGQVWICTDAGADCQ